MWPKFVDAGKKGTLKASLTDQFASEKFSYSPHKKYKHPCKAELLLWRKLTTEPNLSAERNPAFFPIWLLFMTD